jgi:RNA polymerase sigma-70 factor (ECF subfamily)
MLGNRFDAEDAVQDVLIKTWENINYFNILSAKAWMIKTTHNRCLDILRKRKRSLNNEAPIDEFFSDNFSNPNEKDLDTVVNNKILSDKIKEKIQVLPENLKSVFVLYEIQGFKYREISKALDIPLNSVKVYLMRARKKLQEELKSYELQEVI